MEGLHNAEVPPSASALDDDVVDLAGEKVVDLAGDGGDGVIDLDPRNED